MERTGILLGFLLLLCSCSSKKYLAEDEYLLDKVSISVDSADISPSMLSGYLRQQPNSRWMSMVKLPLGIYLISSPKSNSAVNRFLRRMGEAPVVYDSTLSERSKLRIHDALFNMGYLHAEVSTQEKYKGHKVQVCYNVSAGRCYYIDSIEVNVSDTVISREIASIADATLLKKGMPFDANILNQERSRITAHMNDNGYYAFNRDFISYEADTMAGTNDVRLRMLVSEYMDPTVNQSQSHRKYTVGNVSFKYDRSNGSPIWIRKSILNNSVSLIPGDIYRESNLTDTYSRLNRLPAVASTNVRMEPNVQDSSSLEVNVIITPARLNSIQLGLDGTNTAGDFGAALNFTYQNRNVFHGSEVFSLKLRTAFEAIRGLEGYADQNYFEYGIDAGMQFPDFIFPFLSRDFRRKSKASTEFNLTYASQDRPEFHRRVLTGAWKYRWGGANGKEQHRFDLLDVNYVFMPWISDTFYDTYIRNPESRNAIIAYNYKNLFIVKLGYQYLYSSVGLATPMGIYGKDAYTLRLGVETAGNLLHGICNLAETKVNEDGQRTLFNIAYAQYAKFDFDICKSIRFSNRASMAMHFALGIACPYGNSDILPYEKRYFSGGANSVRGWSVRSLGPGSFMGSDGNIDFINQTGDIKLDMSVELRMHLFWKVDGALFVDAGNIWTLRDYKDQPGGQFRWETCWEQIAVAYGLGLRLNLNYFLLRFDAGMKAINPAYKDSERHYPLINPNFKRDFAFHFAVGLPF
ncbi:MAG: BamA/TamA family outer membrane protein [Bacteroidaceae bacterium]|nr:BamA/TamA family outer membrane protein [Bacteroidaceae bacterium]